MVKNTSGGNKNKNVSRKRLNESAQKKTVLQLSADPVLEQYAQVTRVYGNNRCEVLCQDGTRRVCLIGGKFRGRNKRDNHVVLNTWVLVGLRDFESDVAENIKNCDLLCVYDDADKEKLRGQCPALLGVWRIFTDNDNRMAREGQKEGALGAIPEDGDDFVFMDDATYEMDAKLSAGTGASASASATGARALIQIDDEIVDIDDI